MVLSCFYAIDISENIHLAGSARILGESQFYDDIRYWDTSSVIANGNYGVDNVSGIVSAIIFLLLLYEIMCNCVHPHFLDMFITLVTWPGPTYLESEVSLNMRSNSMQSTNSNRNVSVNQSKMNLKSAVYHYHY